MNVPEREASRGSGETLGPEKRLVCPEVRLTWQAICPGRPFHKTWEGLLHRVQGNQLQTYTIPVGRDRRAAARRGTRGLD